MFWTGFTIGIFLGGTIGVVVAGLLVAGGRNDVEACWESPLVDSAVMDGVREARFGVSEAARPRTCLDDHTHSTHSLPRV